ncbi:hypothetical protein DFH07DRAFT_483120 [Mycena maculata]|uniref:Uncharacterized protein n=1 Tax=Mycena maculata TaxID=230809 RepID=A0AAD7NE80_9AGAR|nr:hypothetical protein DFH07DRAFT_483120 [Mycena maculata]
MPILFILGQTPCCWLCGPSNSHSLHPQPHNPLLICRGVSVHPKYSARPIPPRNHPHLPPPPSPCTHFTPPPDPLGPGSHQHRWQRGRRRPRRGDRPSCCGESSRTAQPHSDPCMVIESVYIQLQNCFYSWNSYSESATISAATGMQSAHGLLRAEAITKLFLFVELLQRQFRLPRTCMSTQGLLRAEA